MNLSTLHFLVTCISIKRKVVGDYNFSFSAVFFNPQNPLIKFLYLHQKCLLAFLLVVWEGKQSV